MILAHRRAMREAEATKAQAPASSPSAPVAEAPKAPVAEASKSAARRA